MAAQTPASSSLERDDAPVLLNALDDACLLHIASFLPPEGAASLAMGCKQFKALIHSSDSLWLNWIAEEFGLSLASSPSSAAAGGASSADGPCPGLQLYARLKATTEATWAGKKALHARAIATDGSCDEPHDQFWADNMHTLKSTNLYCSAANTTNVAVFSRFYPAPDCGGLTADAPDPRGPKSPKTPAVASTGMSAAAKRAFIIARCLWPAAHLMADSAAAALQRGQPQDRAAGGSSGLLLTLLRSVRGVGGSSSSGGGGSQPVAPDRLSAASAALAGCSTAGLVEFFMSAYQQQNSARWAASLFKGCSDEQIQQVHELVFELWHGLRAPRCHCRLARYPLLPAAVAAAGPPGSSSQGQQHAAGGAAAPVQQQLELLCDVDQLQQLEAGSPTPCLVHEVVVSRGAFRATTCPVASGFIFLASEQHHSSSSSSSSRAAGDAPAACASSSDEREAAGAAATLAALRCQPWVAAANNLSSAAGVLAAAQAGLLPGAADYAAASSFEWVEFNAPSQEELQQQQEEWHQTLASVRGAASSSSSNCSSSSAAAPVLSPVLWFRFFPGLRSADEEQESDGEEEEEALLGNPEDDDSSNSSSSSDDGSSSSSPSSHGSGDYSSLHSQPEQQAAQEQGLQQDPRGPAGAGLQADAATGAANTPVGGGTAAAAAAVLTAPRQVAPAAVCQAAPDLPYFAAEVAAALGWQASGRRPEQLAVPLRRPRVGSLCCVLLVDAENRKPDFNTAQGGCNIDVQMVMLRGCEVQPLLPPGLGLAE